MFFIFIFKLYPNLTIKFFFLFWTNTNPKLYVSEYSWIGHSIKI